MGRVKPSGYGRSARAKRFARNPRCGTGSDGLPAKGFLDFFNQLFAVERLGDEVGGS